MAFGKNVIFCAPAQNLEEPIRKEAATAAVLTPGSVVSLDGDGKFAAGADDFGYVLDKDHLGQGAVDADYASGDLATAYQPTSGLVLNVQGKASDAFTEDAPVYVTATGTVTVTQAADEPVFGYAAEAITTTADAPLVAIKFK